MPKLDVFASRSNAKLPTFLTIKENAFTKDWGNEILYICPPFQLLEPIVDKIILDKAIGILIIPCWFEKQWFHTLAKIAVKWWDID